MREKCSRNTSQQEVRCTVGCFSEFSHSRDFIWDFVEHELNPCVCSESVIGALGYSDSLGGLGISDRARSGDWGQQ